MVHGLEKSKTCAFPSIDKEFERERVVLENSSSVASSITMLREQAGGRAARLGAGHRQTSQTS